MSKNSSSRAEEMKRLHGNIVLISGFWLGMNIAQILVLPANPWAWSGYNSFDQTQLTIFTGLSSGILTISVIVASAVLRNRLLLGIYSTSILIDLFMGLIYLNNSALALGYIGLADAIGVFGFVFLFIFVALGKQFATVREK